MNHLFAMVRPDTSVAFVANMGVGEDTQETAISLGLKSVAIPEGVAPEEVVTGWCYTQTGWLELPPRPDMDHVLNLETYTWENTRPVELQLDAVKRQRGFLLMSSDWVMLSDVPMTEEKRAEWIAYRQALRDMTDNFDPTNVVWPTPPEN